MNEGAPKFGLYLGLSIAEMLCCGGIFGLIALIMTILGNNAYKAGDTMGGESKMKTAKILLIVGVIVGVLASIFVCVVYGAAIAAAIGSTSSSSYYLMSL